VSPGRAPLLRHRRGSRIGLASDLLSEFPPPPGHLADALTYCDMTTGPDGQRMPVDQRLGEILSRYGPGHVVSRAITRSAPELTAAVGRVTRKLAVLAEADQDDLTC
jgi:hypothetical protein